MTEPSLSSLLRSHSQALSREGLPRVARNAPAPSLLESIICAALIPEPIPGSDGVAPVTLKTASKSVSAESRRATACEKFTVSSSFQRCVLIERW